MLYRARVLEDAQGLLQSRLDSAEHLATELRASLEESQQVPMLSSNPTALQQACWQWHWSAEAGMRLFFCTNKVAGLACSAAVQARDSASQQADELRSALASHSAEAAAQLEAVRAELAARQADAAAELDLLQASSMPANFSAAALSARSYAKCNQVTAATVFWHPLARYSAIKAAANAGSPGYK